MFHSKCRGSMSISCTVEAGIAEIVIAAPPVNALDAAGWHELASQLHSLGADPAVRVVILAADGRGFNAGVDIKELERRGNAPGPPGPAAQDARHGLHWAARLRRRAAALRLDLPGGGAGGAAAGSAGAGQVDRRQEPDH